MSLAFARDGTHCDVSHKMKYSLKKKKWGEQSSKDGRRWREKKNLMSTSNQIRYLLLFFIEKSTFFS